MGRIRRGARLGAGPRSRGVSLCVCVCVLWQALGIDDQYKDAWHNLGKEGGGVVGGNAYSQKQCFQQVRVGRGEHA